MVRALRPGGAVRSTEPLHSAPGRPKYIPDITGYQTGTDTRVNPDNANTTELTLVDASVWSVAYVKTIGRKQYEFTDHLGNVLVTTADIKKGIDANSDGVTDYYHAHVLTTSDYYPFGMPMMDRYSYATTTAKSYRFGFNGQEKDNEVYGEGNRYTAEFWQYDPRTGRRWNLDPEMAKYPDISPYATFLNNPIIFNDPNGDDPGGGGPGGPYVTAYHNTTADNSIKILLEGFKAKNLGWNYFMSDPRARGAGSRVADLEVPFEARLNVDGAKVVTYDQWDGVFNEIKGELGLDNVANGKLTKDQLRKINAIRNQRIRTFINEAGGEAWIIHIEKGGEAAQKFYLIKNVAVIRRVTNLKVARGTLELINRAERYVGKLGYLTQMFRMSGTARFGRTILRMTGETLMIEGLIFALEQKHKGKVWYVKQPKAEGRNSWLHDTYSDVGMLYWDFY